MTYSETQDFAEKQATLDIMLQHIGSRIDDLGDARALEIGGAGGVLAGLVAEHVGHVIVTDVEDFWVKYDGMFPHLLKEKFERNDRHFDLSKIEFMVADAQSLPFRDKLFGLVFSLNAFEHIPDPAIALAEALRVTRPGGLIYLSFDPVWTADSGSHFLHRLDGPWQHLIASDEEIGAVMRANGASDDEVRSYCAEMNRRPAPYYRQTFPAVIERHGGVILHFDSYSGAIEERYLEHPFFEQAAEKTGLNPADLLVRNFVFLIEKIR